MLEAQVRETATTILKYAIRLAPPDTRDWGQAMMSELGYVKGDWEGALWALGSSGVLARQTLVSALVPGSHGYVPDGGLFAKSASVRKAALAIGGGCVLVALLFFASPPFRQAFQVALASWSPAGRPAAAKFQRGLADIARRAEAQHDAEGLAFCAVRTDDSRASVRLAEEAVRLDPNLIWVYAIVSMRHPGLPSTETWIGKLLGWDPHNALLYLIKAESAAGDAERRGGAWPRSKEQEQAWQKAMTAAFQSPQFDDYLDRVAPITRRAVARYGFYHPYEVTSRDQTDLPVQTFENSENYARLLLQSGAALEANGERKGARDRYWTVAHFGQVIDSYARTDLERRMGASLQVMAYRQLQTSFQKQGNQAEAALFGYLAAKFEPVKAEPAMFPTAATFGRETSERNAAVVGISGLMIVVFCGLALVAALILMAGSRRSAGIAARRAQPIATIVILASAVGLLFSAVTLYLTYRPYWYILHSATLSGGTVPSNDLRYFLNYTPTIRDMSPRANHVWLEALVYSGAPSFLFYVWAGVTLLGAIGLALIVVRRFRGPPPANSP